MKIIELFERINYIWVILSAIYHPAVSMLQYSATELFQLRSHLFELPLYIFTQILCINHVGNTTTVGLGGAIPSMTHAQYGHSGRLIHVQQGGPHELSINQPGQNG